MLSKWSKNLLFVIDIQRINYFFDKKFSIFDQSFYFCALILFKNYDKGRFLY